MIRDLLTPEAQPDPYVWAAVLLVHAGIGAALRALMMCAGRRPWRAVRLVLIVYGLFEMVQAAVSGSSLIWDIALDWTAVGLGAVLASALWGRLLPASPQQPSASSQPSGPGGAGEQRAGTTCQEMRP